MENFSFKIIARDSKSKARAGVIRTAHGEIQTPAFVPVGTQASVKSLDSLDLEKIGTQIFFCNTYHLYLRPGTEVIEKIGGLHNFSGWKKPLITDSAGFQVFSLAREGRSETKAPLVRITDKGVLFRSHLDGSEHLFTPEKSLEVQFVLGADIMVAFDECTSYPSSHGYSERAMQRTHRWAERCLEKNSKLRKNYQSLYGVVQGGVYEDLRRESAKFIGSLPFEGVAIGGVAVGESKKEMVNVLDWTTPFLPEDKPRHLLGVGEIDDIFELVERGIDSFDCVMPTRLGRMGFCLTKCKMQSRACRQAGSKFKINKEKFLMDLTKPGLACDSGPIDNNCGCFVCKNYSKGYLHHLFRAKELAVYRLLTFHNLWFMERLVEQIRESIIAGNFLELKKMWLERK